MMQNSVCCGVGIRLPGWGDFRCHPPSTDSPKRCVFGGVSVGVFGGGGVHVVDVRLLLCKDRSFSMVFQVCCNCSPLCFQQHAHTPTCLMTDHTHVSTPQPAHRLLRPSHVQQTCSTSQTASLQLTMDLHSGLYSVIAAVSGVCVPP